MAIGDIAASAGLTVFVGTQDVRLGYQNDNQRGDDIGAHMISGTHPASAITSGTLATARIPDLAASKITSGTFDTARIPSLNANKITAGTLTVGMNTSANVTTGNLYVGTQASVSASSGEIYSNGNIRGYDITGAHIPSNTIVGGWTSVVVGSGGLLGISSSTKATKQDIKALDTDVALNVQTVNFRYKADVKALGDDAPLQIGVIAEQLEALGLETLLIRDQAGKLLGVHYERLALVLFPLVQSMNARLTALEGK
jgi:hypothetical protein